MLHVFGLFTTDQAKGAPKRNYLFVDDYLSGFIVKDDSFPIIKQIFSGSDGKHRALPILIILMAENDEDATQ